MCNLVIETYFRACPPDPIPFDYRCYGPRWNQARRKSNTASSALACSTACRTLRPISVTCLTVRYCLANLNYAPLCCALLCRP